MEKKPKIYFGCQIFDDQTPIEYQKQLAAAKVEKEYEIRVIGRKNYIRATLGSFYRKVRNPGIPGSQSSPK